MRPDRIILLLAGLPLAIALATGCQPITPPTGALASNQPWATPPAAPPIYLEPGEPEVIAPGTPIVVEPTVVLPPGAYAPGSPYAPQPAVPGSQPPGWFDVLPDGSSAISPDFGLPRAPVVQNRVPNPLVIPVSNNELAWDQLADVVSDYFPIQREQPVQAIGGMLTEGYIETPFETGSTILEPHRNDSVGRFNRWQSTLQSIRRKALINVQPTAGGYSVGVNVLKQLEDLPQPEQALSGAAVLRSDNSLATQRRSDVNEILLTDSWIDLGRDEPLEQEMLRRIRDRLASPQSPSASQPVF